FIIGHAGDGISFTQDVATGHDGVSYSHSSGECGRDKYAGERDPSGIRDGRTKALLAAPQRPRLAHGAGGAPWSGPQPGAARSGQAAQDGWEPRAPTRSARLVRPFCLRRVLAPLPVTVPSGSMPAIAGIATASHAAGRRP